MTNIQPVPTATVGSKLVSDVAAIKADLATVKNSLVGKVEAEATTIEGTVKAWIKTNWAHLVTWGTTALTVLKLWGKI